MNSALHIIIQTAARTAPLSIAAFMQLALQHPQHGYYQRHDPLGVAGDFITAPEISQLFGELLGLWCVQQWENLGCPAPFALLELGAGRGTLMNDALRAARVCQDFLTAAQLYLLDSNVDLRQQQAAKLAEYQPQWLDDVTTLPPLPTIIIANEFFDALPIHQLVKRESGWHERLIGCNAQGAFIWQELPANPELVQALTPAQQALPVNAYAEINPTARTMIATLSRHIMHHGGALLAIDYGYDLPTGQPSFQAVQHHAYTNPLDNVGAADLTALVDFGALAQAAHSIGATAWPLQSQGVFLHDLGIVTRAARLAAGKDAATQATIAAAMQRLTAPEAMGELFKVLIVTAGV